MPDEVRFPNANSARAFLDDVDEALGLPLKGRHVGRGPHVQIPDVYVEGAPGWVATAAVLLERSDRKVIVRIDDTIEEAERRGAGAVDLTARVEHKPEELATETRGGTSGRKPPVPRRAPRGPGSVERKPSGGGR